MEPDQKAPDPSGFLSIYREGRVELALDYSELLWPAFVEGGGCVVLAAQFDQGTISEWRSRGATVSETEAVVNTINLWDLFSAPEDQELPSERLELLANRIARTWRAKLKAEYPGRSFEVLSMRDGAAYGPSVTLRSLDRE